MKQKTTVRWYLLLLGLLLLPLSYSLECKAITTTLEIPCEVVYPAYDVANCNTFNGTTYNADGVGLQNFSLSDFGESTQCYFIFNITDEGSYTYVFNNGDSGNILVEEAVMLAIYKVIFFGIYIVAMLALFAFMHLFRKDEGSGVIYGAIGATLSFIFAAAIFMGYDIFTGIVFGVDINYYLASLIAAIGVYFTAISYNFRKQLSPEESYY
jgi:hypothetical protein